MSKDSYWFRHDSTAGRTIKMRKLQHIYSHWGKGVYWDIVELLRDQENYQMESDEPSLQFACDIIGCKDEAKFMNWFNTCLSLGLLVVEDGYFYCPALTKNMEKWEIKKLNGSKGGRPKKTEIKPNEKPNDKANQKHKITEQNRIEDKIIEEKSINTPPLLNEVVKYFIDNGYTKESAERAYAYYNASIEDGGRVWKDSKGNTVKNWKQKMRSVWFKEENKVKQQSSQYHPDGRLKCI